MTVTTMLPELVLRSFDADWDRDVLVCSQPDAALGDYAQVHHVTPDAELASPTVPISAPIAGFFAGAPDTAL